MAATTTETGVRICPYSEQPCLQEQLKKKVCELKQAEQGLEAERRRLRDVLDVLPAYVALLTPDYHVPFANRVFQERFGQANGRRCYEFLFGRSQPCEICETYNVLKTGSPGRWKWTGPDGRHYDIHDFPFLDSDGSTLILEMGLDVTERDRLEDIVVQRSRQQQVVLELGEKALRGCDLQPLMDEAVAALARTLEVEFCKVLELLPDGQHLLLRAGVGWQEGLVGRGTVGAGRDSQAGYTLLSDKPVVVEDLRTETRFSGPPLLHEHGVVSGLSVVIAGPCGPFGVLGAHTRKRRSFNADEVNFLQAVANLLAEAIARKRAEEALRRSEQRLRLHVEQTPLAVIEWDTDFRVTGWNPAAERIFGYTAAEALGQHSSLIVAASSARQVEQIWKELLQQQGGSRTIENITRAGKTILCEWYNTPLTTADGRVIGVASLVADVTERERAERELRLLNDTLEQRVRERTAALEAANRELEAFTYSVSHDLRAPLRHIQGFSKVLMEDCAAQLDDKARHYLDRVSQGSERMARLVDDLLNLARVGRQALDVQPTSLEALVEDARHVLNVGDGSPELEWQIGPLSYVECDPALLRQVFVNLLSNALKFSRLRRPARIEVGQRLQGGQRVFYVRDNGVGFDMRYADKLFGVFQRLHRQEEFEGTGVGLATVQRIVHKHGGEVWAESVPGEGACFYFTVGPAGAHEAPEPVREAA